MNTQITPAQFFSLPEVVELTTIQMRNPFASEASVNARLRLREIAKQYGVESYFGPLS